MDEETLLEHFEAWHIEEFGWLDMKSRICVERWAGFKAHAERCPVVVELPRPYLEGHTENGNHAPIDLMNSHRVRTAIEAAGGRVAQ